MNENDPLIDIPGTNVSLRASRLCEAAKAAMDEAYIAYLSGKAWHDLPAFTRGIIDAHTEFHAQQVERAMTARYN